MSQGVERKVSVTRDQLEDFFKAHPTMEGYWKDGVGERVIRKDFLDALCQLIGVEEEKPKLWWCGHIRRTPIYGNSGFNWTLRVSERSMDAQVFGDWDSCPICSAPRPKE